MPSVELGPDVFNDLEFFLSYTHSEEGTLLKELSKEVVGRGATVVLQNRLREPSTDVESLQHYQTRVLRLRELFEAQEAVRNAHSDIRKYQPHAEWVREQAKEVAGVDPLEVAYFKFSLFKLIGLNQSPTALNMLNVYNILVSPTMGLLSPIIYFLIPYGILVRKFQIKFSFREFMHVLWKALVMMIQQNRTVAGVQLTSMILSLVMYGQGLLNSTMLARDAWRVCSLLYKQMDGLFSYLKSGLRLITLCEDSETHRRAIGALGDLNYTTRPYNLGSRLNSFRECRSTGKTEQYRLSEFESIVDNLLCDIGIALFTKDWCVAQFDRGRTAVLHIEDIRHPILPNGVPNHVPLESRNCIITGPNAAGKSTLIKAVACNVVLAQTIGFAFAKEYNCSLFSWINTQINIPDCKGIESLFQAEMNRCKTNIERVRKLAEDQHALLIFDEIFNSTNVIEGVSAAYAILETLGNYVNTTTLITTHYPYLCKLPNYDRYKMNALLDDAKRVREFPYKLTTGISTQYIALEILRDNFDSEIVDRAIEVKRLLLNKIPKK